MVTFDIIIIGLCKERLRVDILKGHWGLYKYMVTLHYIQFFPSFSKFAVSKNISGFYQMRIENVTAFDAGVYRCLVRRHVRGGTETIAEFKSDLIVLGENHCSIEIKHAKLKQKSLMRI